MKSLQGNKPIDFRKARITLVLYFAVTKSFHEFGTWWLVKRIFLSSNAFFNFYLLYYVIVKWIDETDYLDCLFLRMWLCSSFSLFCAGWNNFVKELLIIFSGCFCCNKCNSDSLNCLFLVSFTIRMYFSVCVRWQLS